MSNLIESLNKLHQSENDKENVIKMTDKITMDYMDVVCNGKSTNPTSKMNVLKKGLFSGVDQSIILFLLLLL